MTRVSPGHALRYDETYVASPETARGQLLMLAGENKDVLEVGAATGAVTAAFQKRGCRVTAIELDPVAAERARPFAERLIVGDVETLDLATTLGNQRFDVAVFGDVLEHLRDPGHVLRDLATFLHPGGYALVSIPNIAHGSVRLALLRGDFDYTEMGLLDRTHLRFFNARGVKQLLVDAGYRIDVWRRVIKDPFSTELELRETDFPAMLVDAVRQDVEAMTYQFVVRARPRQSTCREIPATQQRSVVIDHLMAVEQRNSAELKSVRESATFLLALRLRKIVELLFPTSSRRHRFARWLAQRLLGAQSPDPEPTSAPEPARAPVAPFEPRIPFHERHDLLIVSHVASDEPSDEPFVQFSLHLLPKIRESIPDVRLIVMGVQPRIVHDTLVKQGSVVVLGKVRDTSEILDSSRVFLCLPTTSPTIDRTLGEAMWRGVPAVVSGSTAAPVVDRRSALVAHDDADLVAKVVELYQDEALWRTIQMGALELVSSLSQSRQ